MSIRIWGAAVFGFGLAACGGELAQDASVESEADASGPVEIAAGPDFQTRLITALVEAEPGSTIQLPAGEFDLTTGLSLDSDGVSLIGAGPDATVLRFSGQTDAGEGLLVTGDDVTLAGFALEDTRGDGVKSKGADRIVYRDLLVEWTGGPKETNGAYGVYPVESTDVLIENVTVRGASDAGIYVGQSRNIIVRGSTAEQNVAGIEIENSIGADVYDNTVTANAGGVLVFDLPDLPMMGGHSTRIFNNRIVDNNTRNFAPPGNIVASVPSGTGVIIMANRNVHVFDNTIDGNRTAGVLVTAYSQPFSDESYNPLPRDIVVRDNEIGENGGEPQGLLGEFAVALGGAMPPIVWDGVTKVGEAEPQSVNLVVDEAPETGFVSLGLGAYPMDPAQAAPSMDRPAGAPVEEPAPVKLSHATGS